MIWKNRIIKKIASAPTVLILLLGAVLIIPGPRERVLNLFSPGGGTTDTDVVFTCPMHPDIRASQMGDCPICGMSLVQRTAILESDEGMVTITPQQAQLTGVTVGSAKWRELYKEIDTYGTVDYDETRLGVVSAWVGGRIDRLFIDFTGVTIKKGHRLVEMYSPELISSEREYVLALENYRKVEQSGFPEAVRNAAELVKSTRQRLLWLGLSEAQLDQIETSGELDERMMIYAPHGGTVIEKKAYPGMYVKKGDVLFNIADLSRVWLFADIYEDDIPVLYQEREEDHFECAMHPQIQSPVAGSCSICGMDLARTNRSVTVEIEPRALPGESFEGYISFTDPFLNPETRTVRVRVNVENPDLRLKPGMFARARIRLPAGRMLAVPESAVIHSGTRTIVLVEEEEGKFRPTLVKLGRMWLREYEQEDNETLAFKKSSARYHEILGGLDPDAQVVTSGNFLVGSESQLQGALARMLPEGSTPAEEHEHDTLEIEDQFPVILDSYLAIARSLSEDTLDEVAELAQAVVDNANSLAIREEASPLASAAAEGDIDRTRLAFRGLSDLVIAYVAEHKHELSDVPNKVYCPMADARWLQEGTTVANPYYGESMLRCGNIEPWGDSR